MMFKYVFIVACFFVVNAVAAEDVSITKADILSKETGGTFVFDAKKIDIINSYVPDTSDNVDAMMSPAPAVKIEEWLQKTFFASAQTGRVVKFILKDAYIKQEHSSSESWFKSGQYTYSAMFSVNIQVEDEYGKILGNAFCKAWGAKKISDNTSIEEREKMLSEMADKLVQNLALQVVKEVETGLKKFLLSSTN